jgi:N-acetylmuramic acid 6-phosphate etherase
MTTIADSSENGIDHFAAACVDCARMRKADSSGNTASGLDAAPTEARALGRDDLDRRSTRELVALMNAGDAAVPSAVGAAGPAIAAAVDAIAARLAEGGRLVYVGAGTPGRLAALDAAECETTFSTPPGMVLALVAGDELASPVDQQELEDDAEAGREAVAAASVSGADAVVAVSASGRTPWVIAALTAAREADALTVCVVSTPRSQLGQLAEHEILVPVGPELLAGSTRLKAGTAQKLVLNMISTISMIRLGKTFGDLMVDVAATNEKLHARVRRIVRSATGASDDAVEEALTAADGDAKVAIVTLLTGADPATARTRLAATGGRVRKAVE